MNRALVTATYVVLLSAAGLSLAKAADRTTDALLACADEADDGRRLRCFDAAVAGLRSARGTPAASGAATPAAPPPAAPPAAPPPSSAPAASAEERFGARGDIKGEKPLTEITAAVKAVSAKPHGQRVITLENGQVWVELAPGSKISVKAGDTVKIEAGALGSFFLIAPNGRSSKVSRIR